ncbi:UDP-N-acetylmuramoyl-L-alanine--D-glutamate ligase [Rhabdothermincola salaria]|uniref:UDP-N-acetylmuramoyl-L-alanine--D-glutamate ligase n=1 Tax=Rhabdothermincola salaria TaxID=2903142 RepID=UPI001E395552|nr:UDP-N-acetylmuramoyl-L-alanine--D-glutamate ligase [Rhabdothermincola salaria]MCD9622477.1 UDP-N-acetylmuramoyl-L-alanine--D-glutamate ligase [Rhabdothermincola salaria]
MGARDDTTEPTPRRALVIGLGITGRAVARALRARGAEVAVVEDHPTPRTEAAARSLAVDLLAAPSADELERAVAGVDAVLPSPGVPDAHPVFAAARRLEVPVRSEFDLARAWDDRPVVAVTGTDGKTTVTTMVTSMLIAAGRRAVACGNTDVPLVEAIDDPATDVFVVEASSFRLGHTHRFRPAVAAWLNFAPDHLDVHDSLEAYERAKARLWADLPADAAAVVNLDDPVVRSHRPVSARVVTFGLDPDQRPDATVRAGRLVAADGVDLVGVDELPRALPHDLSNALAAATVARCAGADVEAVRGVLRSFTAPAHRVQEVAVVDGVRWFDDSKATTTHATLAAVAGFDSVVLVAGGRNKGLDLGVLAGTVPPVRAVVAMGEAADEVAAVFARTGLPVEVVRTDMGDVVRAAADLARPGDVVVLSPACTSFDWFGSYAERGDAFTRAVRTLHDATERS